MSGKSNVNERKIQLLREKILTNAHISHNNTQYRLQQLNENQEFNSVKLKQHLEAFAAGIDQAINQYKACLAELALVSSPIDSSQTSIFHILKLKDLQTYLNAEKSVLKQIVDKAESGESASQEDKLHKTMRKQALSDILDNVYKKQLQSEIKYLSEHIITSSGMIYVPDTHITESQENMLNQRLKGLIDEVERLTGLEIICVGGMGTVEQDPCEIGLKALINQSERLQKIQQMLSMERQEISKFEKWVNSFDFCTQELPVALIQQRSPKYDNLTISNQQISLKELKLIEQHLWVAQGNIISNKNCDHEEISSTIRKLVLKANKVL